MKFDLGYKGRISAVYFYHFRMLLNRFTLGSRRDLELFKLNQKIVEGEFETYIRNHL